MSAKYVASVVMVLTSLVGCGASPETDDPEEGSTGSESSALHPRDDLPTPLEPRLPSFDRPVWDLTPYLDELQQHPRFGDGRCVMRFITIYDPGRGRNIEVPITECN